MLVVSSSRRMLEDTQTRLFFSLPQCLDLSITIAIIGVNVSDPG